MILPKTNLSIMDVRNCLGVPSTDLGTLCSSSNKINKWAKYKPVQNNFTTNRPSDWWKGQYFNCGINYTVHNDLNSLATAATSSTDPFPYDPPLGGVNSPYRLGDFCGYDTKSVAPLFTGKIASTQYRRIGINAFFRMGITSDTSLSISDIFGNYFSNQYFGVAISKAKENNWIYLTEDKPLNNGGSGSILFPADDLALGQWNIIQFLCEEKFSNPTGNQILNKFTLIPKDDEITSYIQTFNLLDSSVIIQVFGRFITDNEIEIYYKVFNYGTTSVIINEPLVHIRYGNKDEMDSLIIGEGIKYLGSNITVLGNSDYTSPNFTATGYLPDADFMGGGRLWFYSNNGTYRDETMIMKFNN